MVRQCGVLSEKKRKSRMGWKARRNANHASLLIAAIIRSNSFIHWYNKYYKPLKCWVLPANDSPCSPASFLNHISPHSWLSFLYLELSLLRAFIYTVPSVSTISAIVASSYSSFSDKYHFLRVVSLPFQIH